MIRFAPIVEFCAAALLAAIAIQVVSVVLLDWMR